MEGNENKINLKQVDGHGQTFGSEALYSQAGRLPLAPKSMEENMAKQLNLKKAVGHEPNHASGYLCSQVCHLYLARIITKNL
jgi:hypothetical protein